MRILVTGGTGVIGRALVDILVERGHDVFVTSRSHRQSQRKGLTYIQGDASKADVLHLLLDQNHYDVIVDFIKHTTDEFKDIAPIFLRSTDQYVYLSSCRVYADATGPLSETSERLLDSCDDVAYLQSDEYAIAKARQEDILKASEKNNWTIIRPYITYGVERLQLGFLEKEDWLYRAIHGRTIVFFKDLADRMTTMTWSGDVGKALSQLIGNKEALGETLQVVQTTAMRWEDVFQLYINVLERVSGSRIRWMMEENSEVLGKVSHSIHQRKYDRLYDRTFDNTRLLELYPDMRDAVSMEQGLKNVLEDFFKSGGSFNTIHWRTQGYMDKLTHEHTPLSEIQGIKGKLKYLLSRYTCF